MATDDCFPGQGSAPVNMRVFVLREEFVVVFGRMYCLTNALGDEHGPKPVKRLVDDIDDTGFKRIVVNCCTEPVLGSLRGTSQSCMGC